MISAVKKTLEMLNDNTELLSIVIFSDGEGTCGEDLMKTAKEIKEKYDYRLTFHVIGLNPDRKDAINFGHFQEYRKLLLDLEHSRPLLQYPALPPIDNME